MALIIHFSKLVYTISEYAQNGTKLIKLVKLHPTYVRTCMKSLLRKTIKSLQYFSFTTKESA